MNEKLKKIFSSWVVIILFIFVVLSLIAIRPQFFGTEGVSIRSVMKDSSAALGGMANPSPKTSPLQRERILSLNGQAVNSVEDYLHFLNTVQANQTLRVETNKATYHLVAGNSSDIGLRVHEVPRSNLRKGLDLEGGTRVLLKPAEIVSKEDLQSIVDNLKERLNVYGLSDVTVRSASDLAGDDFILVEIAGVTEDEIKDLLAKQGKFEALIGNETVFSGGKNDITYVCRSAQCSGIDPYRGCKKVQDGYACGFFFSITLSPEAAQRQAQLTKTLAVITESGNSHLSEELVILLDDVEVDRLQISSTLRGRAETEIQITGSGVGRTQQEAMDFALQNMKKLQTVIITGSLPVKLDVVKMDTISPTLGKEFLQNVDLVGMLATLSVIGVVLLRYKKIKIVIPIAVTIISEVIFVLGFAAFVGWNLDLAAIAGIIIVAGTAVDHLVVITDEVIRGEETTDWNRKIKNAMFIVFGAYLTNVAGLLPLLWAGAGLLKGFALTTIAGYTFGVLVARRVYAVVIKQLLEE